MKKRLWCNFFAANLKDAMEWSGVGVKELSEMSGVSEETIKKYRQGNRVPSVPSVVNIAHTLGVGVDELIDMDDTID